jgi:hypothetical protein
VFAALATGVFFGLLVLLGLLGLARAARADDTGPDGAWTRSPVTETFTVRDWGPSCGPAPKPGTLFPGAQVTLRTDGGELVITGAAHPLRTDQCLDPMPTLSRTSHASDGHSFRTSCSTAANDSRHAVVNTAYFLAAGNGSMSIAETGRYEFTINAVRCIADVSRSGSLTRVAAAAPLPTVSAAPAPTQAPAPTVPAASATPAEAKHDCRSPGEPARLEVRPSRKLLKLGDTFDFNAVVLDASGCPTATPIQWTVGTVTFKSRPGSGGAGDPQSHAAQPTVDAAGLLTVPASDFGDAAFDLVATAAGRSAHAAVEVTSAANYDALLAQSGLDSKGELSEPAVAVIATSAIGSAGAHAEDGAARRRLVFVAVIVGLALVLGVVALVGRARARHARAAEDAAEQRHSERMQEYEVAKREREARHAVHMKKYMESVAIAQQQAAAAAARGIDTGPMFCLSCRRELPGGIVFCPFDANRLVTVRGHGELMSGPAGGVCPTCRRGYNPGTKVCPKDGDELIPPASLPAPSQATHGVRGKICPQCGDRVDGASAFCGKDGTQLVMLN